MKTKLTILALLMSVAGISNAALIYPSQNFIGVKSQFSSNKTATFYLDNSSDKAEEYNVTIKKWVGFEQGVGSVLEETDEIKVFPEHVVVPPGKKVPVKILLKKDTPEVQEYYRITFLDDPRLKKYSEDGEKPKETVEKKDKPSVELIMPMAYSMPIFSQPKDRSTMVSKVEKKEEGKKTIVTNTGNVIYRLTSYKVGDKEIKYFNYIFPGKSITIDAVNVELVGNGFTFKGDK